MHRGLLFISCFFCILQLFSQDKSFLNQYPVLSYSYTENDTMKVYSINKFPMFTIETFHRTEEYFMSEDTAHRDFFHIGNRKYLIDSLILGKYDDYTLNFDIHEIFHVALGKSEYIIISGVNLFQTGTNIQPLFIIFQMGNNKQFHFISSYYIENIEDNSTKKYDSIKVNAEKNTISLRGSNLKCIKRCKSKI